MRCELSCILRRAHASKPNKMAQENLELILHDKYGVKQRLLEISGNLTSDETKMSQLRDNQRGLVETLRNMQDYITMLAEEVKDTEEIS